MADNLEFRVDRLEGRLEKLVGVVEALAAIEERQAEAGHERFRRIENAQLETTEKLNALIQVVDEWIRRGPQPGV
jgi:hypothetical protein